MRLLKHQVPDPPESDFYKSILRWLLMVMDEDDVYMEFVASVYSYGLKNEGLTEKQAAAISKIFTKIKHNHINGFLECQESTVSEHIAETSDEVAH